MTPMKKKDLKYAMCTAGDIRDVAGRLREYFQRLAWNINAGIDNAGLKDEGEEGLTVADSTANMMIAYDKFLDEATLLRAQLEAMWDEANTR